MTARIVQNRVTNPDGTPYAGRTVSIQLNVPAAFSASGQNEIIRTAAPTTDATGLWQAPLEPNANIDPANTCYTVRETSGVIWTFIVTAGFTPAWLRTLLIDAPTNPNPMSPPTGTGNGGNAALYFQPDEPTAAGPWLWLQTDVDGTVLDIRTEAA